MSPLPGFQWEMKVYGDSLQNMEFAPGGDWHPGWWVDQRYLSFSIACHFFSGKMDVRVGGWFPNPFEKYARQIGSFPQVFGVKITKNLQVQINDDGQANQKNTTNLRIWTLLVEWLNAQCTFDLPKNYCTKYYPWTPKPWKMKVFNPQYMGYNR